MFRTEKYIYPNSTWPKPSSTSSMCKNPKRHHSIFIRRKTTQCNRLRHTDIHHNPPVRADGHHTLLPRRFKPTGPHINHLLVSKTCWKTHMTPLAHYETHLQELTVLQKPRSSIYARPPHADCRLGRRIRRLSRNPTVHIFLRQLHRAKSHSLVIQAHWIIRRQNLLRGVHLR